MIALLLAAAVSCGSERRDAKQLRDPGAANIAAAEPCTIDELVAIAAPPWQDHAGRALEELQTCTVAAEIVAYKLEVDNDVHLVLRAPSGRTLIAEFPHPDCAGKGHVAEFANARRALLRILPRRPSKNIVKLRRSVTVLVTGVVFFDKLHGQIRSAPNGVELHPVLSIERRP